MGEISAADLANTATAFATILAGVIPLCLSACTRPQPLRWTLVYISIVVTGIATVWYHGFGENFWAGVADGGTNLLLAWLLQVAIAGDFYSRKVTLNVAFVSGLVNLAVIVWRIVYGPGFTTFYIMSFGAFGGFHPMEIMLILDSVIVVALFFANSKRMPHKVKPLLYLLTAIFFVGALLASASNQRIDYHIICYHALWHVVGAFGFLVLWVLNHERRLKLK